MAFEASYSLNTSPPVWIDLRNVIREPGSPIPGASDFRIEEQNITHTTNYGVRNVYRQFTRQVWTLTFFITHAQKIGAWKTLHDTVDGSLTPFLFRIGSDILYCRKEAGYAPRMIQQMASGALPLYQYTITLTEEFDVTDF